MRYFKIHCIFLYEDLSVGVTDYDGFDIITSKNLDSEIEILLSVNVDENGDIDGFNPIDDNYDEMTDPYPINNIKNLTMNQIILKHFVEEITFEDYNYLNNLKNIYDVL